MADQDPSASATDPAAAMRAAAETSVERARKAFEDAMGLAQRTVSGMESNSADVQGRMRDLTRETLDFAGATADATFNLIERLTRAKDPQDALAIQKAFLEEQMERLGRQTRSLSDGAIRAAQDMTKPFDR